MILSVPGDKSLTQRALILAGLADGTSRLSGLLPGADPRSTASALRQLGVDAPRLPGTGAAIEVVGRGLRGLRPPAEPLDLGNSGTGARLLLGVLAGQPFSATVTGDGSLRSRPMRRVTAPLERMGGRFQEEGAEGRLPIRVHGGALRPLEYDLPVASAQVKSALLLAGLVAGVPVVLTEPGRSRDHTERMLTGLGAAVRTRGLAEGRRVELLDPPEAVDPLDFAVPADFSSAAFFVVLALLGGAGSELVLRDVGLNPTRTGLLEVLGRMGARIEIEDRDDSGPEPTGTLVVRPSDLVATEVGADEIPETIDEIPILAVAASRAEGVTRITGAGELRVKETDRLRALALNLRSVGVAVEELDDGLEIEGGDAPPQGEARAFDDHRIAMAFGVLGALPGASVAVDEPGVVDVSYPGFWQDLRRVEVDSTSAATDPTREETAATLVTIDGPAGSGKSTTARAVAERLGWRHLDSGALYRGLTWALLAEGVDPMHWDDLTAPDLSLLGLEVDASGDTVEVRHRGEVLDEELRSDAVTERVSRVAALPAVREWLLAAQRSAGASGRLVADGRDMGTVVFPWAATRVFLDARPRERARRRLGDKGMDDPPADEIDAELERLRERDARDSERVHSPLRIPDGATVIDTTHLGFEEQVEAIVREARRNAGQRQPSRE